MQNTVTSQTSHTVIGFLPSQPSPGGGQKCSRPSPRSRGTGTVRQLQGCRQPRKSMCAFWGETLPNSIDRNTDTWSPSLFNFLFGLFFFLPARSSYLLSVSKLFYYYFHQPARLSAAMSRKKNLLTCLGAFWGTTAAHRTNVPIPSAHRRDPQHYPRHVSPLQHYP